jgi:hypothetical protein
MGKYIVYIIGILVILLFLEWFRIVDIPYIDLPNYTGSKKVLYEKTPDSIGD